MVSYRCPAHWLTTNKGPSADGQFVPRKLLLRQVDHPHLTLLDDLNLEAGGKKFQHIFQHIFCCLFWQKRVGGCYRLVTKASQVVIGNYRKVGSKSAANQKSAV
jgi:hypothetical protein